MTLTLRSLHDPAALRPLLEADRGRFAYLLGDLDPFFFSRTVWYAALAPDDPGPRALVLLWIGHRRPTLLAFGADHDALRWLLDALVPLLPPALDLHIEQALEPAIAALGWTLHHPAPHHRMVLSADPDLTDLPPADLTWFTPDDLAALQTFYAAAYPDNHFDPAMLATGRYLGALTPEGAIAAAAGVHVFSPEYGVAALGNITTHPDHRGQGLGRAVTGLLCQRLRDDGITTIALNVHHQNHHAIRLYQRLGFTTQLTFLEAFATHP